MSKRKNSNSVESGLAKLIVCTIFIIVFLRSDMAQYKSWKFKPVNAENKPISDLVADETTEFLEEHNAGGDFGNTVKALGDATVGLFKVTTRAIEDGMFADLLKDAPEHAGEILANSAFEATGAGVDINTGDVLADDSFDPSDWSWLNEDTTEPSNDGSVMPGKLCKIHFMDVGQGDSTLITYGGQSMLIDAGDNNHGTYIQNYIQKNLEGEDDDGYLDYIVFTHPDADHIGGGDVVTYKLTTDNTVIIMPDVEHTTKTYERLMEAIEIRCLKVEHPVPGQRYSIGGATFKVIAPLKDTYEDMNDYSIVGILNVGNRKIMFSGDAEEVSESQMLETYSKRVLDVDVYKVGHHGSRSSSSVDFVSAMSPEFAVISCGDANDYGHPHAAALNTLRASGVKLFRTDDQGAIICTTNGRDILWNTAPTDNWAPGN